MNRLVRGLLILLAVAPALVGCEPAATQQTLLLVGFRPFVGREANVGQDIVNVLDGKVIAAGGHRLAVRAVVLPVEWGLPEPRIKRAVQEVQRNSQILAGILIIGESDEAPIRVNKGTRNQRGMDLIDFGHDGSKTPGQRRMGRRS